MNWQLLQSPPMTAQENMEEDARLLAACQNPSQQPILRFYHWKNPSATYGYFVDPAKFLDLEAVQRQGIDLARRPTGGGIIFHLWDLAFSVIIPSSNSAYSKNTLSNYAFVNERVLNAIAAFVGQKEPLALLQEETPSLDTSCCRFCMAKPTKYDVMWEGKKLGGAAQRQTAYGFLHQGSISLSIPDKSLLASLLLAHARVLEGMDRYGMALVNKSHSETSKEEAARLRNHLIGAFGF